MKKQANESLTKRAFYSPGMFTMAAGIALLLAYPIFGSTYSTNLLAEVLIFGIFAMSLDLLLGYTGLPSLGHAAFFGLGSYIASILAIRVDPGIFLTIPLGILGASLGALLIGLLAIRAVGVYFLMLTMALSQMFYAIAYKWTWLTGGSDGVFGVPRPSLGFIEINFYNTNNFYYLVAVMFILSYLALRRIVNSPFGRVLVGIRENEHRMRAIGYNVYRYKLASFVMAGAFGGLAGVLNSYYLGYTSPYDLYWVASGHALIMVIVGGAGTLIGPVLGAGLFILLQNLMSSYTERWPIIMGAVFIFFVMAARNGMYGLIQSLIGLLSGKWRWWPWRNH
ncbi:MAG: branched-chain amino acid ABC transporter permease [Clostridia bacterium]|nr:branched-chain amino acid ABC transporter permease [Clostridia bacterium]